MDNATAAPSVIVERLGAVAVIKLNEPENLNALSPNIKAGLAAAAADLATDTTVSVIVITGEGKAFCAGGDLRNMTDTRPVAVRQRMQQTHAWLLRLLTCEKLIITAVHGLAVGAGFSIALLGDLICAADDARFKAGFAGIGAAPDLAVAYLLPRAVGAVRAKDILLTNSFISARSAHEMGLVSRIFPAADLVLRTLELAHTLAAGPSVSFALTKRLLARAYELPLEAFLEQEAFAQMAAFGSADFAEGTTAFMEKRKPKFRGT